MKLKIATRVIGLTLTVYLFTSCASDVIPIPHPDENKPVETVNTPVKSSKTILKDLGLETLLLPSEDRIVALEKSLNSEVSLQLVDGKLAQSTYNTNQIMEIKEACKVKESGSFMLVVKSEDQALLTTLEETFSADPLIECVSAGSTATANQIDLVLKLY